MYKCLNCKPIVFTYNKRNVFDNENLQISKAISDIEKIDGLYIVPELAQIDNRYLILIAGNIGNRSQEIIDCLKKHGCESIDYIDDKTARSFLENQDIYT